MTHTHKFAMPDLVGGLPAAWLNPAENLGLDKLAGTPQVGAWHVTVEHSGFYRVVADGFFADEPGELSIWQNTEQVGCVVREARIGEGGEFVIGTRVVAHAGDRIAIDCTEEIERDSQPRLALIPLSYDPAVMKKALEC